MIIANPIYDTVFKYLMENLEIAKGIISTIIGETIDHIQVKAQENTLQVSDRITFYHLDFIAKIRQTDGSHQVVLIELQKSYHKSDILRFRRYLGEQYCKEEEIIDNNNSVSTKPLPIISIYFLDYYISRTLPAVIKLNRKYIDVLANRMITERNEFIECLSHDSYVIQIPALQLKLKNRLEYIILIFKQENFIEIKSGDHRLKYYGYETDDELVNKILRQLGKAAANAELLRQLKNEELGKLEYERSIGRLEGVIAEKDKVINESVKTIQEKDKILDEQEKALEEKDRALEEKNKLIEELLAKMSK